MKQFKFFQGETSYYNRQINREYYTNIRIGPPEGISNRHWNLLPQDLRNGPREDMEIYIQGWESARSANYNNPYVNQIPAELWNRGWHLWWERRDMVNQNFRNVNNPRPIDETYPEYYDTDEFVFCDVTEVRYDPETYVPYKVMLFRHIDEGNTIEGNRIHSDHPMYNFPDII
jgi:hypothetical protein